MRTLVLVGLAAACLAAAAAAASADAGLAASAGLARMGGAGLVAGPANATEPTPSAWSWHALFPQRASKDWSVMKAEFRAENEWKNSLVTWLLPDRLREAMPFPVQTWFRCWLMCMVLYFGVGAAWCYYAYFTFGSKLFKPGEIPTAADMWEQMKVSFSAMPIYAMLPTLTEYCVEQGWTMAYSRVGDVGLGRYALYFAAYMTSVEFCVYWCHRILHSGVGYKWLHVIHHKYNKGDQMSPFAGLAFHPLDGICQALPYSWTLFYVPMHFLTHEMLLFFTSIWTTNIHDNIHAKIAPVMGAGYHTIHHTLYNYNYGHYFTFVDRLFGTLISPEENEARREATRLEAAQKLAKAQ